jgi:hypothetical protein
MAGGAWSRNALPMPDEPDKVSFLLQFFRLRRGEVAWRGRLERVDSGDTHHMTTAEGLIDALAAQGIVLPPDGGPGTRARPFGAAQQRPEDAD